MNLDENNSFPLLIVDKWLISGGNILFYTCLVVLLCIVTEPAA